MGDILDNFQKARIGKPYGSDFLNKPLWFITQEEAIAELKPTGTYEEMVTFQLGTIATMLADISKSLAILADKAEKDTLTFYTYHKVKEEEK